MNLGIIATDRARAIVRATLLSIITLALLSTTARADIVGEWNAKAQAVFDAERITSTPLARGLAMMHLAMFDAANATGRRYTPYLPATPEAPGASPEAAIHAAARHVLMELFPKQRAAIDAAYEAAIAKLPDGPAKSAGIAAGQQSGTAILGARKADGLSGPNTYRPVTRPGAYVTTALPVMSHVKNIKPFALSSVDQFRPGPPPQLNSPLWARDFDETKRLGSAKSTERTPWQTETARFWVISGADAWNQTTRALVGTKPLPLLESARLYAQVNMALFDGFLAIFDAKYHYEFWRPVTAIRNGDVDGNDATARDAEWTPLIDTPMHPEYPCAHCVADGAAGAVLKSVFGEGPVPEFTLRYAAMPGVTRSYKSIQQLEDEVAMARIWGGVHYRNSNEVGNALGRKVAAHVLANTLRPLR
jgi:hypothetical protein